jgi:hypothetical protein
MAPQPGGVLAALDAVPKAGVIFVAHTGLERMVTVADVWRELPMDKQLTMRFWSVPPHEVPKDRAGRIEWLYDWWRRIDDWIDNHRPTASPRYRWRLWRPRWPRRPGTLSGRVHRYRGL